MVKQAIVTLAVGHAYSERFEQFCRANWMRYAERHGYDLVVFKEPLDTSTRASQRSPAWQKCLVLSAPETSGYERVVWVDSDIYLNPAAPSVVDGVPIESIGCTDEHRFPSPQARQAILDVIIDISPDHGELNKTLWQTWRDAGAWHQAWDLPGGQSHIVQTGVLVMSPQHHRGLLEHVYNGYEDRGSQVFNYEMRPLSHEIQAQKLQHWIDPRFNALVWWLFLHLNVGNGGTPTDAQMRQFLLDIYGRSYFLHFAGCANMMPVLGFLGK